MRSSIRVLPRVIEDGFIHHFHRRRLVVEDHGGRRQRFQQMLEADHHHRFGLGQRHQVELGFEHHAQRALRAHHDLRQIHRLVLIDEFVQVVAAHAAHHFGIAAVDFSGVFARESQHRAVAGGFQRIARRHFTARHFAKVHDAAVGKQHGLLQNVIDGLAVKHAARAAGIVGHHAADGGAAGRGDIGREAQPQRSQLRVQLVQHHARFHARPALRRIHFEQAVVIFRSVDLNPFADRLSRLRRAAAAHRDGAAKAPADLDDANNVFARLRNHHAQRPDLIDAGVGRIERPRNRVETDFACDLLLCNSRSKAPASTCGSNCTKLIKHSPKSFLSGAAKTSARDGV